MNVIVTGASKGIGRAICEAFAKDGHHILMCARTEKELAETAAEITASTGVGVKYYAADLSVKNEVASFAQWCLSHGTPDVLVNNAGQFVPGNCYNEPDDNLETMMNANLYSAYHLSRMIIPAMRSNRSGHIFNMCSIAALQAYDGGGSYSITKFAMNGLSQNLRYELMKFNIKVTTVFPGAVFTDSWKGFDNSEGRIMEARDVASMIFAATKLSPQATVEEIVIRPQKGDL